MRQEWMVTLLDWDGHRLDPGMVTLRWPCNSLPINDVGLVDTNYESGCAKVCANCWLEWRRGYTLSGQRPHNPSQEAIYLRHQYPGQCPFP